MSLMDIKRKIIFVFLIIFLVGTGFSAGVFFGKFQVTCPVCKPEKIDFSLFWETWEALEEKFVDPAKIRYSKNDLWGNFRNGEQFGRPLYRFS